MNTSTSESPKRSRQRHPDLVGAQVALERAARKAREIAKRYGTSIVIVENGQILELGPDRA